VTLKINFYKSNN